ncbi:MAG: transglutaminase domain-containing protein [Proteobacteria bacterium]|nr:transglutaminase domain-containing protein [Pseudomonadota bacterium]NOG60915.1 transglutaminase domain-containing protein [Pseudomonadota bacterium]
MTAPNINIIKDKLKPATPGLTMASMLLWGWQTEFLIYAVIMGILLEVPFFIKWRINFNDKDINQLADLSGILFFITIIYVFVTHSFQGIYKILELLPFALFILMLAQNYSIKNSIKTSALFISVRRLGESAGEDILFNTNISLPYVFICLISASSGNKYNEYFFISSSLIILWVLWNLRAKHYHAIYWLIPVICAICISFLTQQGIQQLQDNVQTLFLRYMEQYGFTSRDSNKTITYIGALGRLKLSDRILFRVKPNQKITPPLYFRESSYSKYEHGTWRNIKVEFDSVQKTPLKNEWRLNNQQNDTEYFDVAISLLNQSSIIPVPDNVNTLSSKDISKLETSVYGSLKILAREGLINYRLGTSDLNIVEAEPVFDDLDIPLNYKNDFKHVAKELDLYSKTPNQIIDSVARYFNDNFYYSVSQDERYPKGQYLTKFLFKDKKGHCEYFATATALLLREAGIATRYTIGYSVQEYSFWQDMYLVRARHAHSWVKYYMNGKWYNLDTTPSIWAPMEAEDRMILEPLMDLISWIRYKTTGSEIDFQPKSNNWLIGLIISLLVYLTWRFYNKQRINIKKSTQPYSNTRINRFGEDSPLYPLIQQLEQDADKRLPGETLGKWIKRILPKEKTEKYLELINYHNRYRFNPISDKRKDKKLIKESLDSLI